MKPHFLDRLMRLSIKNVNFG